MLSVECLLCPVCLPATRRGPQFGDMKSSNFLLLAYVTAELRTYRSKNRMSRIVRTGTRMRTFPFWKAPQWLLHLLPDDVDVRRGRLDDIRGARRRVTHSDKEIKNQISLDCPSASASPLSLNHRDVPDDSLLSFFLSAVRRFSLITALMSVVDQRQSSFHLWLGLQREQKIS